MSDMLTNKRWIAFPMLMCISAIAFAVNVRGRVDIKGPYGVTPYAGADVRLCNSNNQCATSITGNDGIFTMSLSAGQYVIIVNGKQRANISIPNTQSFDIAPLFGR